MHRIGGSRTTQTLGAVKLTLESLHSQDNIEIHAHILRAVTSIIPSTEVTVRNWPHLQNLSLANPEYYQPRSVDIILGADVYDQVIKPDIIRAHSAMPIAQLSIFGWLILGPTNSVRSLSVPTHHVSVQREDEVQELLTKFWVQEEFPRDESPLLTPEEEECEAHFCATLSRDSFGRYIVRIPLKTSAATLGLSYQTASRCLQRTIQRLKRDSEYGQLYLKFMTEYEQLGHMRRVLADASPPEVTLARDVSISGGLRDLGEWSSDCSTIHSPYYLPHQGVLKPDSSSTKLRVVFNGSRSTSSGKSVNDIMHTGTNLLLNIVDVLTWIRHHRHIFPTDIVKMYRQVQVHPDDWDLQRIL
ncbi:uncharacterized protein LOC109861829 [Pseudomyrmex gracilis]|uniref:uncharacterized protein LOC109861829 n=1 Tax=Pseudomyrmex gracilis TaxID=219809 RepID=UPI0009956FFD|nr:uncharacterized protein LOC109861829 [Pseudomyrmex gracilis]